MLKFRGAKAMVRSTMRFKKPKFLSSHSPTISRGTQASSIKGAAPVNWLNASPCGRSCATCESSFNCMNVRRPDSWIYPLHWSAWGVLAAFFAFSSWALVYPKSLIQIFVDEDSSSIPPPARLAQYQNILNTVGLNFPSKIMVLETDGYGPTSIGSDSRRGGVIFLPKQLVQASLSSEYTQEDRAKFLEEQGTLIPVPKEFAFLVGHEATHLLKNHAIHTAEISLLAAFSSVALIKSYNAIIWSSPKYSKYVVNNKPVFLILVMFGIASTNFVQSWLQEFEADRESATRLGLLDVAVGLKEKQVKQNQVYRDVYGDKAITSSGNDLSKWEHPPATLQLANLQRARDKQ